MSQQSEEQSEITEQRSQSPAEDKKTAFCVLQVHFPNPSEKIKTFEFLQASFATVSLINRFGKIFSPVTYDMGGNISKLTGKYEEDESAHLYLEDMILNEHSEGGMVAVDALLWLRRGLNFLSMFFQLVIEDTMSERCASDLAPFLRRAYVETLEPYHGWLGMQLFNVLSRFAPSRRQLFFTLGLDKDDMEDVVLLRMRAFNNNLRGCVRRLEVFYQDTGLESAANV
ncbi:unnamed protein product [Acanthoscelides obtectus]|uniref:Glycolipid transfer protein domain-containing protein n=1 Tax=Acanthoscelides obtectus TaxID=200917 RepID=A0A9P0Q3K1_ACAOB|nr:unnamed protein product [Acanthoscelides obtectus]CAK1626028.1 Pleckstrin homology domain-containing family A member 8 [Acanthoscelides obtectus]